MFCAFQGPSSSRLFYLCPTPYCHYSGCGSTSLSHSEYPPHPPQPLPSLLGLGVIFLYSATVSSAAVSEFSLVSCCVLGIVDATAMKTDHHGSWGGRSHMSEGSHVAHAQ